MVHFTIGTGKRGSCMRRLVSSRYALEQGAFCAGFLRVKESF